VTLEILSISGLSPDYELLSLLGSGGMGAVYKARDKRFDQVVAIKVVNQAADEFAWKRMRTEAQAMAELDHPNIIQVLRLEPVTNGFAIVMDYVEGIDLASWIKSRGPLTPKQARAILSDCAQALQHAHTRGIIHRDLKPANILVTECGGTLHARLADFGIAKFTDGSCQKLTQTGTILGSPEYISPEVCRGEQADQRSDIYSLGCVMYTALTGDPPIVGESAFDVMYKHMTENVPAVVLPTDSALSSIIGKCTEFNPDARFQTSAAILQAVNSVSFVHSLQPQKMRSVLHPSRAILAGALLISIACFIAIQRWSNSVRAYPDFEPAKETLRVLDNELSGYCMSAQPKPIPSEYFARLDQTDLIPHSVDQKLFYADRFKNMGRSLIRWCIRAKSIEHAERAHNLMRLGMICSQRDMKCTIEPTDLAQEALILNDEKEYARTIALLDWHIEHVLKNDTKRAALQLMLQRLALSDVWADPEAYERARAQVLQFDRMTIDTETDHSYRTDTLIRFAVDTDPDFPYGEHPLVTRATKADRR
jgi:serine/threonine protein kinase